MTTNEALENLVNAFISERGCSRLIAASYAAEACVKEYNAIQEREGCGARDVIVAKSYLEALESVGT